MGRLRLYFDCFALLAASFTAPVRAGLPVNLSLSPTQDAFVREEAPTLNYGGAGLLCVGGAESVNEVGQPNGRFDSVIQFDAAEATSVFDGAYGPGQWVISSIELKLTENAAPGNPLFPRGVGSFSIGWISADEWTQGNGSPGNPMPGGGTVITWSLLQSLLSSGSESALGTFSSTGQDGSVNCSLPLDALLEADLRKGGAVSLHLTPATPGVGFSFHSTNYFDSSKRPVLRIVAVPRGDADGNGQVTVNDVGSFVTGLLSGALPAGLRTAVVDMNQDGQLDGQDVQAFVARLVGP